MSKATIPLLIIATGIGWLLSTNGVMPGVDWAWVLLMSVTGILILLNSLNRFSVVFGPLLMICSVLMVLMQTKRITVETGLPCIVIALGILMLISRFAIPDEAAKHESDNQPD